MFLKRTVTCGELRASDIEKSVVLNGWVSSVRDHGGLIFIDLRDRWGVTQVVFDPNEDKALHAQAEGFHNEYVVAVEGEVAARPEGTVNESLPTGRVELRARRLELLSASETPPFEIDDHTTVGQESRLTYRFLDLRRESMQRNLVLRHEIVRAIRRSLEGAGFLEIETPFLTKSTPEGARDFLVPSRTYPGHFYALPQSPQLFKQMFMVSGLDRYYQIVRCFRDEDLRGDRQPEFTQLDLEMSFVEQEDVLRAVEAVLAEVMRAAIGHPIGRIPRMDGTFRHRQARHPLRYGTCRRQRHRRECLVQGVFLGGGGRRRGPRDKREGRCREILPQGPRRPYRFCQGVRGEGARVVQGGGNGLQLADCEVLLFSSSPTRKRSSSRASGGFASNSPAGLN
jgi:aspartyl-tRNA synthetase